MLIHTQPLDSYLQHYKYNSTNKKYIPISGIDLGSPGRGPGILATRPHFSSVWILHVFFIFLRFYLRREVLRQLHLHTLLACL